MKKIVFALDQTQFLSTPKMPFLTTKAILLITIIIESNWLFVALKIPFSIYNCQMCDIPKFLQPIAANPRFKNSIKVLRFYKNINY